jgi:hypothetical protein
MASPWKEGTWNGSPFINQYVDILNEKIAVEINEKFDEALFKIEYSIETSKDGIKIPLLFIAMDFKKDFKIWVDGVPKTLEVFAHEYDSKLDSNRTKDFNYFLDENGDVTIWWNKSNGTVQNLNALKYFEVDLPKGKHLIQIEYVATPWILSEGWVKEYHFRYSLSPAKYWKSFNKLEVELNNKSTKQITTRLAGQPQIQKEAVLKWEFDSLPTETFEIIYIPPVNNKAAILISIGPYRLSLIVLFLCVLVHFFLAKWYRKKSSKKYSWVIILGSILSPFIMYLSYVYSYVWIDSLIGEEAVKNHGYEVLVIIFYPINLAIYLAIAWQVDKYWLRKKENKV